MNAHGTTCSGCAPALGAASLPGVPLAWPCTASARRKPPPWVLSDQRNLTSPNMTPMGDLVLDKARRCVSRSKLKLRQVFTWQKPRCHAIKTCRCWTLNGCKYRPRWWIVPCWNGGSEGLERLSEISGKQRSNRDVVADEENSARCWAKNLWRTAALKNFAISLCFLLLWSFN